MDRLAVRFVRMPNTPAANKILGRYGASVVKAGAAAGFNGTAIVSGHPFNLVSMTNISDRRVCTMLKAGWDNLPEWQAIHFFSYFGILSMAKPPVCMASHAAASIGKIDPLQVGGQAMKSVVPPMAGHPCGWFAAYMRSSFQSSRPSSARFVRAWHGGIVISARRWIEARTL